MQTFKATEQYVKRIGRTHDYQDALWVALSGGGIEFSFTGKRIALTLHGDQIATTKDNHARVGIYVNEERVIDDLINEPQKIYTVLDSGEERSATIRVVKLTEAPMSTLGIHEIRTNEGAVIKPTPERIRKIEFVGDSITAGYGVDDEDEEHHFSTATEDVTKTYAYKTAQALQAEYSIVAYSGYGIISGYTANDQKVASQLVPTYYDKVGMSYGRFGGTLQVESIDWDFSKFVPDLIVINLGTNDDSYALDHADRQAEYAEQYIEFLKKVRSHNANATILCTLGIMGDRLFPMVERAVAEYSKATGDTNIDTLKFDVQSADDGYAADWHPTEATQTKAAAKLTDKIRELMRW
jgi:lysophospholipase L1-like esterase